MPEIPASNVSAVRVLLYGDVNLNVMDGSAIWLPSLAETFALTGAQVHVQLKAPETRDLLSGPLRRLRGVTVHEARVRHGEDGMSHTRAAEALEALDAELDFDVVLVRGSEMCLELVERGRLKGKLWSYITEYGYIGGGFPDALIRRVSRQLTSPKSGKTSSTISATSITPLTRARSRRRRACSPT